ncbi:MAG: AAA family ATPase, partial [Bacteroidota bacterium]
MAEIQTPTDTVRLQVAGAQTPDVGKGVARLSADALTRLGVAPGAVIELRGPSNTTAAIALPPYPADAGLPIVRLDGLLRANASVGMGDHVEIAVASVSPAQKVVLAPAQPGVRLQGRGQALLRTLLGRPLVAGDTVSTSVYRSQPGPQDGIPGLPPEVAQRLFGQQRAFGLQEIRLVVVESTPRGV